MTRRAVPLTFGFIAGLCAAYALFVSGGAGLREFLIFIALGFVIGFFAVFLRINSRPRILLISAAFIVGLTFSYSYTVMKLRPLEVLSGQDIVITGRIVDATNGDRSAIVVRGEVNGIPAKVLVYVNGFGGRIGDGVTLSARASAFTDGDFFDARRYYLPDSILLYASGARDIVLKKGSPNLIERIRAYSVEAAENIRRALPSDSGQFLTAMVTGDRSGMSDSLNLKLNRSGAGHLASVSGFHVSVVAAAVYLLTRKLRFPRLLRVLLCETVIAGFIVFSGLRISAVRAAVMMTVAVGAEVFLKRTDPLNTICLTALALCLSSPYVIADSSFQLSFAGVYGVAVMAPNLIRAFGVKSDAAKAFAVSLCAQLATAPFILMDFNELSVAAPFTNLFAVPVSSLALVLGMLYTALGCRPRFLVRFAGALLSMVIRLCDLVSGLKAAYIPSGSGLLALLAFTVLALGAVFWLTTKNVRKTAVFAAFCASLVLLSHGAMKALDAPNVHLTVISHGDDRALVLRKSSECIIIDFDGGCADYFETVAERCGITAPRAAVLRGSTETAYSAYSAIQTPPEMILLPADALIFRGTVPYRSFADGGDIELPWCSVTVAGDTVHITAGQAVADISLGAAQGDGLRISILNGAVVINDGDGITVYNGSIIKDMILC